MNFVFKDQIAEKKLVSKIILIETDFKTVRIVNPHLRGQKELQDFP